MNNKMQQECSFHTPFRTKLIQYLAPPMSIPPRDDGSPPPRGEPLPSDGPPPPPGGGIDTINNEQITSAYYAQFMTDLLLAVCCPRL